MKVESFEELKCWQKAKGLISILYKYTYKHPLARDFELKNQLLRAGISIMSNIAEGFGRGSNKEFVQFLYISRGSANELISHLYIAFEQQYINREQFESIYSESREIAKMVTSLINYLQNSPIKGRKYKPISNFKL